jgi:hypothetical protein
VCANWRSKGLDPDFIATELERAIRRYARALDGRYFDAVMIKLWSVLELLTASTDF